MGFLRNKKVLIIRFSSIGDIVLCSPIIRSIKQQHPNSSIHFLSKSANKDLLIHNPYLDRVHLLKDSLSTTLKALKAEKFDFIIDLHRNLRSLRVKLALGAPSKSFPKKNFDKYKMVRLKNRSISLDHIVERYGETLSLIHTSLDKEGLDFFLPADIEKEAEISFQEQSENWDQSPIGIVLGAKHATKRWIPEHFIELLNQQNRPALLIGGPDAKEEAERIASNLDIPYWNIVGQFPLLKSAALMKQCTAVIAHDTGFMHIAAAFKMKVYSIWGNTVPAFGMTPYKTEHVLIEQQGLSCRPCSKIGFDSCPKGHFDCMRKTKPQDVAKLLESNERG